MDYRAIAVDRLGTFQNKIKQIDERCRIIAELKTKIENATATLTDDQGGSKDHDIRLSERLLAELIDEERKQEGTIRSIMHIYDELVGEIDRFIPNEVEAEVLRWRELHSLSNREAAQLMHYSEPWLSRIYNRALSRFGKAYIANKTSKDKLD